MGTCIQRFDTIIRKIIQVYMGYADNDKQKDVDPELAMLRCNY
jgi:hypothetical protein